MSGDEGTFSVCTKSGLKLVSISASPRRVVTIKAKCEAGTYNECSYLPDKDARAALEVSTNLFLVAV